MRDKVVRPERRQPERRQGRLAALGEAVGGSPWEERRVHCWDLEKSCTEERRKRCSAHFIRRNCWDLWGTEYFPPGRKPCCHPDLDCSECPIASAKFGSTVNVYVEVPNRSRTYRGEVVAKEGLEVYCTHLFSIKENSVPRSEAESRVIFRCQHRTGIQLHESYVFEVCGSPEHKDCPFFRE